MDHDLHRVQRGFMRQLGGELRRSTEVVRATLPAPHTTC